MKIFLALLILAVSACAQSPTPSATPISKAEALARLQAKIAEQRAQSAAADLEQKASRDAVGKEWKAAYAEWESCTKIIGTVLAIQPEGIRLWGHEIISGQPPKMFSYLVVGYPDSVKYDQYLSIAAKPDGTRTYRTITGFDITLPAYKYFGPSEGPKQKSTMYDHGVMKGGFYR